MKIMFEEVFPEYVHSYGNVISIPIIDTDDINLMIDEERVANGMCPFFNSINGKEIDIDGWYEVRLILDRASGEPQEIEAWTAENCGADEEDNNVYHFPITNKKDVWNQLTEQLKLFDVLFDELKEER